MAPLRPPTLPALHGVPRSLFIPLIVRAQAAAWCPHLDPQDHFARSALARSGESASDYPLNLAIALNILWRTRCICEIGRNFFVRHPQALGINLGAGLSQHFQWLDNGRNRWLDADLPEVLALRQQLLDASPVRHGSASVDLRRPGWWRLLGLPGRSHRTPLLLVCEGVLMYLQAQEVQQFFDEIGAHAPNGTELVCDFISPLGVGQTIAANRHGKEATTFTWGAHHAQDIAHLHPRLQVLAEHSVAEAWGWCGPWLQAVSEPLTGGPLYGLAHLQLASSARTDAPHPR